MTFDEFHESKEPEIRSINNSVQLVTYNTRDVVLDRDCDEEDSGSEVHISKESPTPCSPFLVIENPEDKNVEYEKLFYIYEPKNNETYLVSEKYGREMVGRRWR